MLFLKKGASKKNVRDLWHKNSTHKKSVKQETDSCRGKCPKVKKGEKKL